MVTLFTASMLQVSRLFLALKSQWFEKEKTDRTYVVPIYVEYC